MASSLPSSAPAPSPPPNPLRRKPRSGAALFQPRAELARVQPARARGSLQRAPSAARAAALPVDLGEQPRRILHGPRRRPQGAPDARGRGALGRRHDHGPAIDAIEDEADRLVASQEDGLARSSGGAGRGRRDRRRRRTARREGRGLARPPFPRADLPGADPAGDRPCAPLPVHPEQGLLADLRAEARQDAASASC